MAGESLGLTEGVSIALGGMIGGGIFAVLGVVAQITHAATWFAFLLAGVVALSAGYAFNRLNAVSEDTGGSVTMVQCYTGNSTLAGMVGWTLLFGYIGSMAMYAYAFGSYTVGLAAIPESVAAVPLRPAISVGCVAGFVGLNLLGARATGMLENVLVGLKVAILLVMGFGGLWYGYGYDRLVLGLDQLGGLSVGPVMAAAVSFVAFQGWQLLFYDHERFADPVKTIRQSVYLAIPAAVGIYLVVAITTLSLAPPSIIQSHPERALAVAADPFLPYGFLVISIAALFSTGSAINATLFSSGYFAKAMLADDLLPDRVGDAREAGIPTRTLLVLGGITAAFTAYGSLGAITSFASLAFIVVFGGMSSLALGQRHRDAVRTVPPLVGTVGSLGFFGLLLWHLYRSEPGTLVAVGAIAGVVVLLELLYFERDVIEEEVTAIRDTVEELSPSAAGER